MEKDKESLASEIEALNRQRKISQAEFANRIRSINDEFKQYKNKYVILFF